MAQQAKDIYSGIKKIFPSSRRSGSFSLGGRSSSSASQGAPNLFGPDGEELSAAALAAAHDADRPAKERKKKERRPSFSFSSWGKDKHRSSSSASTAGTTGPVPSGAKPDAGQVVMSLPYGAQAATPKGYTSPSHLADFANQNHNPNSAHAAPARGSLYNEPSAAVTSASSKASASAAAGPSARRSSAHRSSASAVPGPSAPLRPVGAPHAFSSTSLEPPKLGGRSASVDLTSHGSSGHRLDDCGAAPGSTLLQYASGPSSSSGGVRGSRRSRNSTNSMGPNGVGPLASAARASVAAGSSCSSTTSSSSNSGVRSFSTSMSELAAPSGPDPVAQHPKRRDSLSVYRHNMTAAASHGSSGSSGSSGAHGAHPAGRASLGSHPLAHAPAAGANAALLTPERPMKKKERRTSLSFTSSRKKQAEALALAAASATSRAPGPSSGLKSFSSSSAKPSSGSMGAPKLEAAKPHASTWDSDSDDDYEDSRRPTRGLDRRSQSMDFMEQAPTHLISKLWRKLPIQARLIGGRGSIDLDLQKDRNSFSRSSNAKQQQQLQRRAADEDSPSRRPPSPVPDESNVFGDKRVRFRRALCTFPEPEGGRAALEGYDEVLVRVCRFAAHDKRRTATKVQEFLERSLAFLHGTRTKHGNVVSISNEEIRMWRRLALHDWASEEPVGASGGQHGVGGRQKKDERSSSSVSTAGSDDSDEPSGGRVRPPAIETMSEEPPKEGEDEENEDEDEDEEEEEEELKLPRRLDLAPLREVVNCCVGFGERLFTADELDDLVRLEFLVEEDGWI